jgi:hypothetical protein
LYTNIRYVTRYKVKVFFTTGEERRGGTVWDIEVKTESIANSGEQE